MEIFLSNIKLLTKRLLVLMLVYTFCRIYFVVCNLSIFSPIDWKQFMASIFYGLRFDYSSIFMYNILFYLMHFLPFRFVENPKYQNILRHAMIFFNMTIVLLNIIDTGYYPYQNSRSGADYVTTVLFSEDTTNLLPQYICDYWYHLLIWVAMYVALELYMPRYKHYDAKIEKFVVPICALIAILYVGISFMIYRGFGVKPLRIVDAVKYVDAKYSSVVLNTPFTVFRSIGKSVITIRKYYSDDEVEQYYSPIHHYDSCESFDRKNVVIFVLEGFSQRSIGALTHTKGYTPFLDSIIAHSHVFTNAFSNGTKSIQAIPSILSSMPQLMETTIIGSKYSVCQVDALPNLLKNEGYHTSFFHGAYNGSMGFDKYCAGIGFEEYYGMDEFMQDKNADISSYDSDWGIFDDKFLIFVKNTFDKFKEPFFSSIFTISSHHPFVVPKEYAHLFNEDCAELNALRYADFSLQKFFGLAKNSTWFKNTLFVFVADHTVPYAFKNYRGQELDSVISPCDRYRIPIVFYDPNDSLGNEDNRIAQQIDIEPSLLYKLKYSKPFVSFGRNLFDTTQVADAIYYAEGIYTYIDSSKVINFDGNEILSVSDLKGNPTNEPSEKEIRIMKSTIQDYTHRLSSGKLSYKFE